MPGQHTGAAEVRILKSRVGTSPVQEGQGKTGPAAIYKSATKKTPEVWLQLQILADEPPDLLWDFAVHFGRVDVSWSCTRPVVPKVVTRDEYALDGEEVHAYLRQELSFTTPRADQ